MSPQISILRFDREVPLNEVFELLDQANSRLCSYASDNRDLSWNVVMAADLVNQARQYTARAIKEVSCG